MEAVTGLGAHHPGIVDVAPQIGDARLISQLRTLMMLRD